MASVWMDRQDLPVFGPLAPGGTYDVVVAGAGLTGMVTALLLARSGCRVAVLEARHLGAGTTGHTTAKVSLLQGTRLSSIGAKQPDDIVRAYVEANTEGQQWLLRYCDDHGVPVQRRPAYTYATTDRGEADARAELDTCRSVGIDAVWTDTPELPYPTRGAVRLDDQAQFDPMDMMVALVEDFQGHGGVVFDNTRVTSVQLGSESTITTDKGEVTASQLVLATGIPVLDRGGYFARLEPLRSYALAFEVPHCPSGMYLSAESPTRSLRSLPRGGTELLLVGGNGHTVGRRTPTSELVEDLASWTREHFTGATLTHSWSAQDYESIDSLPYVGSLTPGGDRCFVATGYDKWGMTNAVAAALALSSKILGGNTEWAEALDSWRLRELGGLPSAARLNASVALHLASGWVRTAVTAAQPAVPAEGQGHVERDGFQPVAVCTVDGRTRRFSAVCPHMRGILTWNDAEASWDCPLHGSRFSAAGDVLEGPATSGLDEV
jgi:glycine/D-amino acid oxidase-like deaminating enzyme/nitrite reductase/ring-hydroxylating ferredoxin subunit